MRMRKLPWAEDFIKEQEVVVKNAASNRGKWKDILGNGPLHVEIGTGKGDYWVNMGKQNPDACWIGIEKDTNVAALAVRKFMNTMPEARHMLFINQDAEIIEEWFADGEIDIIHLNFSDPWPKKRAHKKRLSSIKFIEQYDKILHKDGEIQMKTDNKDLFEFSVLQFQNANWFLHDFSVDYRRIEHPEDVITEYETRFMNLNQPIYRAVWKKKKPE